MPNATTPAREPARIADISPGAGLGRIGVTPCPGRRAGGQTGDALRLDLDAIRDWGAAAVVTLVELHELKELKVEAMGAEVAARGMAWLHLAIADYSTPDAAFEALWETSGAQIRGLLRDGRNVLVHCKGGLGRSGTIAARLLVELGAEPAQAILAVRAARPGAIETAEQERHVLAQRVLR